jgi:hypothetical protein
MSMLVYKVDGLGLRKDRSIRKDHVNLVWELTLAEEPDRSIAKSKGHCSGIEVPCHVFVGNLRG